MHLFQRKSFSQLLDISAKNFIFLKTFNGEFSYNKVWLNDQDSEPLEIEDKVKIKYKSIKMTRCSVQLRYRIFAIGYGFLSFAKNMVKNTGKNIYKNLFNKYKQKLRDHAKQSTK